VLVFCFLFFFGIMGRSFRFASRCSHSSLSLQGRSVLSLYCLVHFFVINHISNAHFIEQSDGSEHFVSRCRWFSIDVLDLVVLIHMLLGSVGKTKEFKNDASVESIIPCAKFSRSSRNVLYTKAH